MLPRPRLTDRLRSDGGGGTRLVLVAAPAGFGKSTLLAQWLAAAATSECGVAWLALDPSDADPRRFLTPLVAAVRTAEPEAGVDALAQLEADGGLPIEAALVSLINDLDALADPIVVALDDYHVIDGTAVHEALAFLVDHLPPRVTLAIGTRPTRRSRCPGFGLVGSCWRCGPPTSGSPPTRRNGFSTR